VKFPRWCFCLASWKRSRAALGSLFVTRPSLKDYTANRGELEVRAGEVGRKEFFKAPAKLACTGAAKGARGGEALLSQSGGSVLHLLYDLN